MLKFGILHRLESENLVWLKGQRPPSEHLFRLSIEQVDVWTDDVKSGPDEGRRVNSQLTNVDSSVFPLDIMNLQPAKKEQNISVKVQL